MLDANIKSQLAGYLERLQQPIELVASLDDSAASQEMRELIDDIAALSTLVSVREDGSDARRPSFSVGRAGDAARVRFAGLPMGHEFTSLVLALLQAGGHPPKVDAEIIEINAGGVGRDASELLRKIKAAQYVASHPGEVCPAKWKEGEKTLAPSLDLVGKI